MLIRSTSLLTILFTLGFGSSVTLANPLVSSSLLIQPDLIAQSRGWSKEKGEGREALMKQLNLSSQQQEQLTAIRQKNQGTMKQMTEQLRKNQEELKVMMDGNASASTLTAKHDQVMSLRQQLEKLRFQSMLESREVLNPEQRKQFGQLMNQRRAQMRNQKSDRLQE